ncbi:hypothetical protein ACQKNB_00985 [Lysinibacillus xylanilyticus]|uniref:hypothetical protein n=1 Tax=Lysinibacillus xylanilyticus TaxID=582475 RepID=UPI003CFE9BA5
MKNIQKHYKDYQNRKNNKIHVSYNFTMSDGRCGFGRMNLTVSNKATTEEIENHIKGEKGFKNVVVLSWQPSKTY